MAILNFPTSNLVANVTQYTGDNGTTYIWDGVKWIGHAAGGAAGTNSIQNGSNTVQVDSHGILVLPAYSFPNSTGTTGQVLAWPGSGTTLTWATPSGSGGNGSSLVNESYTVSLGTDGTTTFPNGQRVIFGAGNGNAYIQAGMGFHISSQEGISLEAVNVETTTTYGWLFGGDGNLHLPGGAVLGTENGLQGPDGGYGQIADYTLNNFMWVDGTAAYIATNFNDAANIWSFGPDGNLTLPLSTRINSGGVAITNSVEFGTVVATNPFPPNEGVTNITNSEVYMSGGSAETRIITDATTGSLVYTGVEHVEVPAFAGLVAVDPGVESQYSIAADQYGQIQIGAVQDGGVLTTPDYTVGVGTLNNDYTVNGLLATTDHTYLQGNFGISMNTERGQIWFGNQPEGPGQASHFHIMKGNDYTLSTDLFFGDDYNYVKLPGADYIGSPSNPYTPLDDSRNFGVEIATLDIERVEFQQYKWRFNTAGGLEFPDNSIQTTAWDYRSLENIDMDGGAASTVYSVNVKFAEGGYASTRFSKNDTAYIGANAYGAEEPEFTLDGGKA